MDPAELTLCINAGGRGRRLGGLAKGLLEVGGRPVLERLLDLRALASSVLLVANEPGPYAAWGLPTVGDVVPDRGAPGGVVTALVRSGTPWVLVVACDMPFVTPQAVAPLLAAAAGAQAVVYERGGRLEPLLGLYRTTLGPGWQAALDEEPSLQSLVTGARPVVLQPADPHWLDSLNTPEELAAAREGRIFS